MEEFFGYFQSLLRAAVVIVVVLYMPGRALSAWLFPHGSLDAVARNFVAVAASIALSSVTAATLVVWMPGGLTSSRFLIAIGLVTLACLAGAHGRRSHASTGTRHPPASTALVSATSGLALPFVLLLVAFGAMLVSRPAQHPPPRTEFYISPSNLDGLLAAQPDTSGERRIPVTISNRDTRNVSYRIEAWENETMVSEIRSIDVDSGAKRDVTVELPRSGGPKGNVVELKLIEESTPDSADELRLSVTLEAGR